MTFNFTGQIWACVYTGLPSLFLLLKQCVKPGWQWHWCSALRRRLRQVWTTSVPKNISKHNTKLCSLLNNHHITINVPNIIEKGKVTWRLITTSKQSGSNAHHIHWSTQTDHYLLKIMLRVLLMPSMKSVCPGILHWGLLFRPLFTNQYSYECDVLPDLVLQGVTSPLEHSCHMTPPQWWKKYPINILR